MYLLRFIKINTNRSHTRRSDFSVELPKLFNDKNNSYFWKVTLRGPESHLLSSLANYDRYQYEIPYS